MTGRYVPHGGQHMRAVTHLIRLRHALDLGHALKINLAQCSSQLTLFYECLLVHSHLLQKEGSVGSYVSRQEAIGN